ncbi:MAG: PIN domain-containing protein [Thermodesulfobacteriota bacterium]
MRRYFIDSNILVYANDRNAGEKQDRAIEVIGRCMKAGNGVISIQVLQEYANIALTKLMQDAAVVLRQLALLDVFRIIAPSSAMVRRMVEIRSAYRISFWNAGIVAAAETAGCDCILSEDLNPGQFYAGVKVVNPLAPDFDPAELNK